MGSIAETGPIAIIGVACTYPGARTAAEFWENIVRKVDATADVSTERWDPEIFYDPNPATEDRIYCKRGGWLPSWFTFNPVKHGIMPNVITGAEPDQFLVLRTVCEALEDAGYLERDIEGVRASVILGKGNYMGPGGATLMYRSIITQQTLDIIQGLCPDITPEQLKEIRRVVRTTLAPLHADMAGGLIPNVSTGRTANRLDFMGKNFTVDAACASSLIALELAADALASGKDDLAVAGGVHLFGHVPFLQVFDAMRALSLDSVIRPFDDQCDGTMSGEGVGILILKRLADAERDGDRIYAVIRAIGSSSDGRARGITAPRLEGEVLALRRAYDAAGVDPRTVGLIEGHGTGTVVGDGVEIEALRSVFGEAQNGRPACAVGSVKSMIGHAMPAAGAAGAIKAALSLYHRVLPPTINVRKPRRELVEGNSPFYVNTEARPWIHAPNAEPRRAGVSAFGFGGINAHILMEEYRGQGADADDPSALLEHWDSEMIVLEAPDRLSLAAAAERLLDYTARAEGIALRDIAYTINSSVTANAKPAAHRAAIVATSVDDLSAKLTRLHTRLSQPECPPIKDREGLYYFGDSAFVGGKVALMLPGEGSQYVNMLAELCLHFPTVRKSFDAADAVPSPDPSRWPLSAVVFPPPFFSEEEQQAADARLWSIERATEAVLTADGAIVKLLADFGLKTDMMVGHSAGEWVALAASGVLDVQELVANMGDLTAMYRQISESREIPRMAMLAVGAGRQKVESIAGDLGCHIYIANDNCPHQVVMVAETADSEKVSQALLKRGIYVELLQFDRGYHTPVFTYMCDPLRTCFSAMQIQAPRIPLYSCNTAEPYPSDAAAILEMVTNTFARPLHFRQTIEAMYNDGARIFVEAGPRGNLTAFVDDILRGKPHLSVPVDQFRRPGLLSLNHALAMLAAAGVSLRLDALYAGRSPQQLSWDLGKDHPPAEEKAPGAMQISLLYPRLQTPKEPLPPRVIRETVYAPAPADTSSSNGAHQPSHNGHASPPQETPTVLDTHFALMQQFLETQEAVMNGLLGGAFAGAGAAAPAVAIEDAPAEIAVEAPPAKPAVRRDPLIRAHTVLKHEPGREIVLRCEIDAREHLYLEDHCLYPRLPIPEAIGAGLFAMPLTGSLEMLAETAAMLCPEQIVVGLRDILAPRWLEVEESGPATVLEISARRISENSVRATLRGGASVLTEGTVMFADRFPDPAPPLNLTLRNERRPQCLGDEIYTKRRMFHGPRFQGITGVERVGEDGVAGGLKVLPFDNLFRSDRNPAFHFDFYLLDAAGQFVGYWPSEYYEDGIVAVPVRIAEIQFFRRDVAAGHRASCRARLRNVTHRQLVADYDVIHADGTLWMRVIGWEDWRFHWGSQYVRFWCFPDQGGLGARIEIPELAGSEIECRRFDPPVNLDSTGLWEKLMTRLLFTPTEFSEYQSQPSENRTAWATAKAAGKDAIHAWIQRFQGRNLYPIQIEDQAGRARLRGVQDALRTPYVSVDHQRHTGVAVASAQPVAIVLKPVVPDEGAAAEAAARDAAAKLRSLNSADRKSTVHTLRDGDFILAIARFEGA